MRTSFLAIAVLLLATSARASVIGKGTVEISTAASFTHTSYSDDVGSSSLLNMQGGVAYAVSDLVQLGGSLLVINESYDFAGFESESSTASGFQGGFTLNLGSSTTTIPYLGATVGMVSWSGDGNEDSEATVLFAGEAGFRFLVSEFASFNAAAVIVRQANASGIAELDATAFALQLGISVFPGGLK